MQGYFVYFDLIVLLFNFFFEFWFAYILQLRPHYGAFFVDCHSCVDQSDYNFYKKRPSSFAFTMFFKKKNKFLDAIELSLFLFPSSIIIIIPLLFISIAKNVFCTLFYYSSLCFAVGGVVDDIAVWFCACAARHQLSLLSDSILEKQNYYSHIVLAKGFLLVLGGIVIHLVYH